MIPRISACDCGSGPKLLPFSPLHDVPLPDHLDGLYLGGGYPEVFARESSANK